MLEPTFVRGDIEVKFGCVSAAPVFACAPAECPLKDGILLGLLCTMLSMVFSMKTLLFLIAVSFFGELESVNLLSIVDR